MVNNICNMNDTDNIIKSLLLAIQLQLSVLCANQEQIKMDINSLGNEIMIKGSPKQNLFLFINCEIEYKEIVFDYKDVQGLSEEVTSAVYFNQLIRWCESADKLLKSVESYLQFRLSGLKTMKASEKASMEIWMLKNIYCSAVIREYVKNRSIISVKKFIDKDIFSRKLKISGNISTNTIWKYLHEWRYLFRKNSKDIYYDNHKRADIIAYRQVWAKQMISYKSKMSSHKIFYSEADRDGYWTDAHMMKQLESKTFLCSSFFTLDARLYLYLTKV
ncbi:hypothetical protein PHYBLDRAFT_58489 [Phycomyces blakesleeanus NRRL 1555(-)]|uniref:Uncharacterized protein n=1 Tax=Phycomyces blakesleeanus (strain ATCC 8743b / DSM 1359 / FGSC 10004 / NBRC 33097 / NRRL 1555) TaxID=763407 RepID=A0A162V1X9_PHYB8|nr:hypothetical protein PHYBLDRAFT_58489 [Phycomyces blakesleeanus NRRL 1555(-)]OAD79443.1 hypothetical protein PHYBLDRAFT_58489 [Phycomyces blakesleeanus NRRL 1555(-)]|eukprot:XP_018297483.1 hypothetical protein PHYBLDRAFT_58489 [Phycomyces blakesleeanus NRRL 1555(-)]